MTEYKIVPGNAMNTETGEISVPVWRVVQYVDGECRGGMGSFFIKSVAETWVELHRSMREEGRM